MEPQYQPNNKWPVIFKLTNDPINNNLYMSYKGIQEQNCGFQAFDTNKGLQMYIAGGNAGQVHRLTQFDIKYYISTPPTPSPTWTTTPPPACDNFCFSPSVPGFCIPNPPFCVPDTPSSIQCCDIPPNFGGTVSTVNNDVDDRRRLIANPTTQQITVTCPDGTQLIQCAPNYISGDTDNIRGVYSGPQQPLDSAPAQIDVTQGIDTQNQCIAEAGLDTNIEIVASCFQVTAGFKLDCVTTGILTDDIDATPNCPIDYDSISCSPYITTNSAIVQSWYMTCICCQYGEGVEDNESYIYIETPKSYQDAQEYCQNEYNSNLATIQIGNDRDKADDKITFSGTETWIGLYSNDNGMFTWLYGKECEYPSPGTCIDFWGTPKQNGINVPLCVKDNGYKCSYYHENTRLVYNDLDCDRERPFLCGQPVSSNAESVGQFLTDENPNNRLNDNELNVFMIEFIGLNVVVSALSSLAVIVIVYCICCRHFRKNGYEPGDLEANVDEDESASELKFDLVF